MTGSRISRSSSRSRTSSSQISTRSYVPLATGSMRCSVRSISSRRPPNHPSFRSGRRTNGRLTTELRHALVELDRRAVGNAAAAFVAELERHAVELHHGVARVTRARGRFLARGFALAREWIAQIVDPAFARADGVRVFIRTTTRDAQHEREDDVTHRR